MTRHFFALMALLSGLAALSSPAHASLVDAMACDTSVSASTHDDSAAEAISANAPPSTPQQSSASDAIEPIAVDVTALRLPVLMGIERAYE
ncbi:MAG: hypothetical protein AAF687_05865 [Pseudomonadota bacterium]